MFAALLSPFMKRPRYFLAKTQLRVEMAELSGTAWGKQLSPLAILTGLCCCQSGSEKLVLSRRAVKICPPWSRAFTLGSVGSTQQCVNTISPAEIGAGHSPGRVVGSSMERLGPAGIETLHSCGAVKRFNLHRKECVEQVCVCDMLD